MARGSDTLSRVASVADYNSDDGEIADTRKQANVAAKRSGGLGKDAVAMTTPPQQHVVVPDQSSDSGAPIPSEVHTATSSTSPGDEIVVRNGKKYKVCKDPNCTKSHRPKKSGRPPKSHAMSPPREKSPASDERPPLRRRSATDGQAGRRPNSIHGGMVPHSGYLPPPMRYPYHMAHMVVNRTMPLPPERPGPPHRNSEWSTRRVAAQPFYGEPLPKQKPKVTVSMRKPVDPSPEPPASAAADDGEDEEDPYEAEVDRRLRIQKARELKELERERKSLEAEWRAVQHAWQQHADRTAMPPPPLPLRSAMRRSSTVAPKVTYDDDGDFGPRHHYIARPPSIPPPKTYSHERGYDAADAQRSLSKYRRKSLVGNDRVMDYATSRLLEDAEFGRRQRELMQVNQANARASRESQTIGGDSDDVSDRLDHLTLDQNTRPKVDSKIHAAEHYMGRKEETRYPLTERVRLKSGFDRDAVSTRSKRISKDGSTTTATGMSRHRSVRSNSSSRSPETAAAPSVSGASAAGFQLRIDTGQKYDLEVGAEGQHITLHPTPDGTMNLVYHGARVETPYHSTRASTSTTTGSRIGRSLSQRSAAGWRSRDVPAEAIVDDDDEEDDDDVGDEDEEVAPPRTPRTARPSVSRRAESKERRWAQEEEQRREQRHRQQQHQQQQQAAATRRPTAPAARRMSRREDDRPPRPPPSPLAPAGDRRASGRVRQAHGGYAAAPTPPPGPGGPYSAPPGPPPSLGQGYGYFGAGAGNYAGNGTYPSSGNYHGFGA